MVQPPIVSLADIRLSFGGKPLFEGVDLTISKGERAALVGRNGAGKSTLMKIVDGRIDPDAGDVWFQPGIRIVTVEQEPDLSAYETSLDFVLDHPNRSTDETRVDLETERHRAEAELMGMALDPAAAPQTLSGGQQRRAALARAFATDPDILLLDEPTNHLDVPMINRIEARLKAFRGAVLLVSHDRKFLEAVSTNTLWLRQGTVLKSPRGYAHFETWATEIEAEEKRILARMKTQLKDEQRWLARGVTGRRKRNMGRLDRLKTLRAEHARRRSALSDARAGAALSAETAETASRKIIDVRGITKTFQTSSEPIVIADNFSVRILRGDRIGIIGPNGAGKTTLLKLMLKELAPDSGSVKLSKTIQTTFLDQTRETLNPKDTIWETLAPNGGDSVMVQETPRHVGAYARDFLFGSDQLRQPVGALSGGERNRLTLAVALARKCDLLVLDEPTNDLDMQTLDLLEDMLEQFAGTLIIVSHDRAFLDNTVTSCICPIGEGKWVQTAGGWSDAEQQLAHLKGNPETEKTRAKSKRNTDNRKLSDKVPSKLTFKDTHRLKELETLMPQLLEEVSSLETKLADPDLYTSDPAAFQSASERLAAAKEELDTAELDWLTLEEKREAIERA
ncbi:MAG: ABC-F family ATP-binding cassette domain-containing protein [Pseudomonadota bacterium]